MLEYIKLRLGFYFCEGRGFAIWKFWCYGWAHGHIHKLARNTQNGL